MLKVAVYNQEGQKVKDTELNESVFGIEPNNQAIFEHLFANPDDQNSLYSYCIKSNLERFKSFLNMKLISNEQLIQLHTYVVGSTYVGQQIVIGDFEMSLEEGVNYLINNIPDFIKTVLQIDQS